MPRNRLTKNQTCLLLARFVIAALCAWPASSARAVTTSWNTNASGIYTTAANWDNGVPDGDDTAVFDRGFVAYEVNFPGGSIFDPPPNYAIDFLRVHTNEVSFVWENLPLLTIPSLSVLDPGVSIIVAEAPGDTAILNMTLNELSGVNASIGLLAGANGTLNVGGTFNLSSGLDVGNAGTGTMNVTGGGSVSNADAWVGRVAGSNGTVTVGDAGSTWTTTGRLGIGGDPVFNFSGGAGSLIIGPGGDVTIAQESVVYPQGLVQLQGGTLNLHGNTTLDGGSITRTSGDVHLAAGRTLTAQNNAQINLGNSFVTLSGGTIWNINSGSDLTSTGILNIGFSAGATSVTVDGAGSSLSVGTPFGGAIWGSSGQTASVTVRNGATANITGGLGLAFSSTTGTTGVFNVESGADVVMGDLQINNVGGASDSSGAVTITGSGSTLTQSGASQLIVGSASGGAATINVADGGNYTTGTGLTRVNATGLINVNTGTFTGFEAKGDVLVDGGAIHRQFGLVRWGATLTIQNGGDVILGSLGTSIRSGDTINVTGNGSLLSVTDGYVQLESSSALNVTSGGDYSANNFRAGLGAGTATVLVDGIGSTIVTESSSQLGASGGTASITFRNGASGSLGTLSGAMQLAYDGVAGSAANVSVLSDADLGARSLEMAMAGVGTATLTVDGGGSNFTQLGAAAIMLGHASSGSAVINVRNSAVFTTGTGPINVQATGAINVESGAIFDARGPITLNGGAFNFLGGALHVDLFNGNLLNQGGTLAPGHFAGNTTIVGNYTQQAGAKLQIEIGGTSAGGTHDLVSTTGAAILGGQLQLAMLGGFAPDAANTFTVLNAGGGIFGVFANVTTGQRLATVDGLGSFIVNYGPGSAFNQNQIVLSAFQPSLSADFDNDGDVDSDDLTQWRGDYGVNALSDADNDGDSDGADFLAWQQQLGSGPAVPVAGAVPEPTTGILLLLGLTARMHGRRHGLRRIR